VLATIGHFRDETTRAAVGVYAQAGLPLVAPGVLDPDLTRDHAALYRLGPSAPTLATVLLERAARLVAASPERGRGDGVIVLVAQGGPLEASLHDLARETEGDDPGWRFATVAADSAGWRMDLLTRDPAVILCDLEPVRAGEVVAALRRSGWSGQVLGGPALAASDFAAVAGQSAHGATYVTPWPFPPDVPGGDAFAVAYRGASNGVEPGPLSLPAYEATWMLLEALDRSTVGGEPTRQAISAALSVVEREGVLGRLAFDEAHTWSGRTLYWYRIGPEGVPRLIETAPRASVGSPADLAHLRESG
jgi:ABC-type branched-subunit amino acid transport system substrate-binding protein